ncbi:PH domain-containing protein [Microbacterium sp. YJN-G]|uniref:PH domain-containing protein n=1 Tax=Microbacterium sp. YJN-G TaxID=2763257 RepID=UPI001D0C17DD|nr:PH domain-containing protein [Microbacterium sp. YJN-G]
MTESSTNPPRDPNSFDGASQAPEPVDAPPTVPAPPAPPAPPAAAPATPPAPPATPPAPPATPPAPAAPTASGPVAPPALDDGTYEQLRTPRNPAALALDGVWHQISPRYVASQFVQNAIFIAIVVAAAFVIGLVLEQTWVWVPAAVVIAITVITLIVLPRQAKALGYMLRDDDVVFRKGILWQRMVAVPYGRMQLVDITQGPLDRAFGVSQLKMVTAAATTGVQIPGLTQGAAEALRDTLIEVAETRRTGL